jgi:hypothetical protein
MKNFKFFGIIALIGLMAACTKNIQEPSITDIKSGTPIPVQALSTSPCGDVIKSVAFDGTMLVFQDGNQFSRVMECLAQQVDDYGDAFDNQVGGMTDEQAETYAQSIGFDEDQPLINFENNLGFYSLRTKIESDLVQWLNHPVLDENTDPDNHVVIDDVLRALLNPAGKVNIGGTVYDFNSINDMPRPEGGLFSCYMNGRFARNITYDNNKKRLWVRTSLVGIPFSGHSVAKTKAVNYKLARGGRKWQKFRTETFIQLNGGFRDFSCDHIGTFTSEKKKKRRKLVDRYFSWESNFYPSQMHWLTKNDDFGSLVQLTDHPDVFLSVPIKMIWY